MDARTTGRFIALKRKELALTQEQLAAELGVSNKAVSKWETGRCLPDSSLMEPLCDILGITFNELLSGKALEKEQEHRVSEETLQRVLGTVEQMQHEKRLLIGVLVIVLGIALMAIARSLVVPAISNVMDFFGGFLEGLSIVMVLVGVFVTIRELAHPPAQ